MLRSVFLYETCAKHMRVAQVGLYLPVVTVRLSVMNSLLFELDLGVFTLRIARAANECAVFAFFLYQWFATFRAIFPCCIRGLDVSTLRVS